MQWPRLMRRPLNIVSMPTVVTELPIVNPGFAFGDPRKKVPSLERAHGDSLMPFNELSKSFVAPYPRQGENTRLLLERIDDLPAKMLVAFYESKTPLWPNFLIHNGDDVGTNLQAVRSCLRNQGRGFTEAWCVLPARQMSRLLRSGKPTKPLLFAPNWQNKRFLSTARDHQLTLKHLENSLPLTPVERLTVVMPHFDDEVLQCGGALLQAIAANSTLQVIWLSDGSRGVSGVGHQQSTRIRVAEAQAAMAELGVKNMHFLDGVETKLTASNDICLQLNSLLEQFRPQRVHSVWWADNHVDHYEANLILQRAWPANLDATIAASGLWQVMPKRTIVELTSKQQQTKIAALQQYKSQIAEVDYLHLSKHLDAYFADGHDCDAAENFWHVAANEYFAALESSQVKTRRWYG
ncbi:MAG: PIG-L family deacetylase [Planctomycetes bacterium]|nr:PIG-L family deacetylase [Planctomycetota bacterium]